MGGGVVDRLRQLGYDPLEVQFGGRAYDPRVFVNKRAEMWGTLKDWLKGGAIPDDDELAADLTGVEYSYNAVDQVVLERKESMKRRGLASPDNADALALTFAAPTPMPDDGHGAPWRWDRPVTPLKRTEYDPLRVLDQEIGLPP